MLGTIIGDVIGSIYRHQNHRRKAFELFNKKCFYTDNTRFVCAVAKSLLSCMGKDFSIESKHVYVATRVSPVAWFSTSEEETKELAWRVTETTNDNLEDLKGSRVVSLCVYKALHGCTQEDIKKYAISNYPVIENLNYSDLVENYRFNDTCQGTIPQAIYCFLISKNFEDCLRLSVSIGGDSSSVCSISCAIAEAYYGIPKQFKKEILKYFNEQEKENLLKPINEVYKKFGIDNHIHL